jgi:hypothetical protein
MPRTIPKNCLNCNQRVKGRYCSTCGQDIETQRISARYVAYDIPTSVFSINKGFFFTLKELLTRPGHAVREFLQGKRAAHFKPLAYLFILSAATALIIQLSGYEVLSESRTATQGRYGTAYVVAFFNKFPALIFCACIPLISLLSWTVFKKQGNNIWEHFILNTYLTAQYNIFMLFAFILNTTGMLQSGHILYSLIPFIAYLYLAYRQFYTMDSMGRRAILFSILLPAQSLVYLTVFSVLGLVTPWWNF